MLHHLRLWEGRRWARVGWSSRLSNQFTLWQKNNSAEVERGCGEGTGSLASGWKEPPALEQISTVGSVAECQGSRALFLLKYVTS